MANVRRRDRDTHFLQSRASALLVLLGCGGCGGSDEESGAGAQDGGGGAGGAATSGGTSGGGASATGGSVGSGGAPATTECFGRELPPRALIGQGSEPPSSALEAYWPTTDFRTADPNDAGMDPVALDSALSFMTEHSSTQGIVVVRHGYIVGERYVGFSADQRHESFSMAKSFSSALVGIAIEQGLLSGTDETICEYYSTWDCADANDPRTRITVEHIMNLTSGLEWHEDWRSTATGVNDVYLALGGLVNYVLSKPAVTEPGTVQRYSTADPALLTGVLQGATGMTAHQYALANLLTPIGLQGIQWGSDSAGRTTTYAGIQATAREYAKFGYLYLRRGQWDGQQIVPTEWIQHTTQAVDLCTEHYRYLWHINPPMRLGEADPTCPEIIGCPPVAFADLPASGYFAEGVNGQFIFILPSEDLVIARVAQDDPGSEFWDEYARGFLDAVLAAVRD